MTYREPLPDGCPPDEAEVITTTQNCFRLVRTAPATVDDFRSQRAEKPDAIFNVSECRARGLSVYTEQRDAENALKLPALRGRFLCRVSLEAGAGSIQQTGRPSHHTGLPLADYDILASCKIEIL